MQFLFEKSPMRGAYDVLVVFGFKGLKNQGSEPRPSTQVLWRSSEEGDIVILF